MASGYGVGGGVGRCFPFWQEYLSCYIINQNDPEARKKGVCLPRLEDYYECLHHKKEHIDFWLFPSANSGGQSSPVAHSLGIGKKWLLDKGSTQLVRNETARQLANIQEQNPESLFALLGRVVPYLQSKSWDTRVAAARAIGGIVEKAGTFDPNAEDVDAKSEHITTDESDVKQESLDDNSNEGGDLLRLATLDIRLVLQHGKKLVGSAGREHAYSLAGLTPAERLAHQKKTLHARLGLLGEYVEDEVPMSDNIPANSKHAASTGSKRDAKSSKSEASSAGASPHREHPEQNGSIPEGLSKRQLNQLKRKNKSLAKGGPNKMRVVDLSVSRRIDSEDVPPIMSPRSVKVNGKEESCEDSKPDFFSIKREDHDDNTQLVKEFKGEEQPEKPLVAPDEEHSSEWPYEVMCDFLSNDLFDPAWEVRHGAAMGLREILRTDGRGAGRRFGASRAQNERANIRYLDDLACRLLCVLMLDRFGDYVSDTVVAPIRESIGQTLGALLTQVNDSTAIGIYQFLQKMVNQSDIGLDQPIWEVCHGGMIGLRYFVAVRKDLLLKNDFIIDGVISAVTRGLGHHDDDVKSVSAATLLPIASELVKLRPNSLGPLMNVIWDCLLDMQDDLSASTGAIMDLLATLCSYPEVLQAMQENAEEDDEQSLNSLVPRLYPFLRHTITSVRLSVLKALATFFKISSGPQTWIDWRLTRLLFQNLLLERNDAVLRASFDAWVLLVDFVTLISSPAFGTAIGTHVPQMLKSVTQPIGQARAPIAMDTTLLIKPSGSPMAVSAKPSRGADGPSKKRRKIDQEDFFSNSDSHNTDAHMINGEVDLVGTETMLRTRIYCARALGLLLPLCCAEAMDSYWSQLLSLLTHETSSSRLFSSLVMVELAKSKSGMPSNLSQTTKKLQECLDAEPAPWYADILQSLQAARGQCQTLLVTFQNQAMVPRSKLPTIAAVCQGDNGAGPSAFSLADAEAIVTTEFDRLIKNLTPTQRVAGTQYLTDSCGHAKAAVEEAKRLKDGRDAAVRAGIASVLVALRQIPKKPGQIIKCIMDSIKGEEYEDLQSRSASVVGDLIDYYVQSPKRGPVDKLVSNLAMFSCVDTSETPEFAPNSHLVDAVLSLRKEEDRKDHPDAAKFLREAREARVMRRGATKALQQLAQRYGTRLFEVLPVLQSLIEDPLKNTIDRVSPEHLQLENDKGQEVVDALSTLRTITPLIDSELHPWAVSLLPIVAKAMRSRLSVVRYMAAKTFAALCNTITVQGLTALVEQVVPHISNPLDLHVRQGATECIYHLIQIMGDRILPYVIFLIVPVLGRMSDANDDVRLLATTSFATLVKLVPLEAGIPDPPGMPESLLKGRERERKFMEQMLNPKKVEPFQIPVAIKAELRPYQQDGVNWLAFLNKYNLHGVLCDDMGLGKTLQTLCMVASDHHMRAEEYSRTQAPEKRPIPSLIVCPPSLSGHWQQEIKQFAPFLKAVAYVGGPSERHSKQHLLADSDIVITTYDICRNESSLLTPITWNYCVLDEGHLIKNPKAKITQAAKRLVSNHRLILTGTPIQNNVLELWSLFDFLMPGFLGTERVFADRFTKPIQASRNAKSSSKEQEAGALAVDALHKQVLPFLLRRLKEEVLNDLPPKILQNYYCDLSDLQKRLFEDFFKKEKKTVEASVGSGDREAKTHIFQALQYMRKLCNSPALVLKEGNKDYETVQKQLEANNSSLRDVAHAPKLLALKDLLLECGIGVEPDKGDISASASNYVSPHRALIFCQMKEMLDMVQTEVLGKLLPSVQFLRLDGSVESTKRQNIVNQFNNDPSYDCLLLTTSVGGLGLNLTGADTVIFVEHDWNPQKDIQAMDRAHRIGQKKVVNVYRLITRGTLEEKILSLQRFKIDVASTVVNQQNAGLGTMETDQILDLFNLESGEGGPEFADHQKDEDLVDMETGEVKKKGEKGFLGEVPELWDERQYEEEFNLDSFVQNLQRAQRVVGKKRKKKSFSSTGEYQVSRPDLGRSSARPCSGLQPKGLNEEGAGAATFTLLDGSIAKQQENWRDDSQHTISEGRGRPARFIQQLICSPFAIWSAADDDNFRLSITGERFLFQTQCIEIDRFETTAGTEISKCYGPPGIYWRARFDASRPVSEEWEHKQGDHGWGNNELQNYTDSPQNSFYTQDGKLVLRAISQGGHYTSARLVSRQRLSKARGCLTAWLTSPCGNGIWPAFWLLPFEPFTWPTDGEVDIAETWNGDLENHSCLHWGFYTPQDGWKHRVRGTKLPDMAQRAVKYEFAWEQNEQAGGQGRLVWWIDGRPIMKAPIPDGQRPMRDFQVIINVAMGGNVCQGQRPQDGTYDFVVHEVSMSDEPDGGWARSMSVETGGEEANLALSTTTPTRTAPVAFESSVNETGPTSSYEQPTAKAEVDSETRERLQHVLYSDIGVTTLLQRLKSSIGSARDFAGFLRERSSVEEKHAQGLKRLCRGTHELIRRPDNRGGSFAASFEEIVKTHDRMADNGLNFATSLHQMLEELNDLAAKCERDRKHLKASGLEAERTVHEAEAGMTKAKAKYNTLAEQLDAVKTGEKTSGKFGRRKDEDELRRKLEGADNDYAQKVQSAKSLRRDLQVTNRPRTISALQDAIRECDAGLSLQMQKYAALSERFLLSNGLVVSPLKDPQSATGSPSGPGSGPRSLRELAHGINNQQDLHDYILGFSNKVGSQTPEAQYEQHPSLAPKQQQPSQPNQPSQPPPVLDSAQVQQYGIAEKQTGFGDAEAGLRAQGQDSDQVHGSGLAYHPPPADRLYSPPQSAPPPAQYQSGPPAANTYAPSPPPQLPQIASLTDTSTSQRSDLPSLPQLPADTSRGSELSQNHDPLDQYSSSGVPANGYAPPTTAPTVDAGRGALADGRVAAIISSSAVPQTLPTGGIRAPQGQSDSYAPPSVAVAAAAAALNLPSQQRRAELQRQNLLPLRPVFGVPLEELFRRDNSAIPHIVYRCIEAVDLHGLDTEGIYRVPGSAPIITELRQQFDHDASQVDLRNPAAFKNDIAAVTTLLKHFLRDLPDPLLTASAYGQFIRAAQIDNDDVRRDSLHAIINSLPDPNYATLRVLVIHLHRVAQHAEFNRMTTQNLAICFGPTLMGHGGSGNGNGGSGSAAGAGAGGQADVKDAGWQARVIETIINNTFQIFDDDE
ncbi:hypothetical protein DV738_g1826, partial [Chaetothyriales sp. CBS 135597]